MGTSTTDRPRKDEFSFLTLYSCLPCRQTILFGSAVLSTNPEDVLCPLCGAPLVLRGPGLRFPCSLPVLEEMLGDFPRDPDPLPSA